jgi:hypothetical protein
MMSGPASLNDFARNGRILIKRINRAQTVIAVSDDDLSVVTIPHKQNRRQFSSAADFGAVFGHVGIVFV